MNINKDGKTLYFSDEEIDNTTNGEKKVFVTKRINGKESHVKIEKNKKNNNPNETFNFDKEIVIGVQTKKSNKKNNTSNKKNKSKQRKYQKQNRQKLQQKKSPNKAVIGFISVLTLIIAIIIIALTAPIFNITAIEVNGNNQISTETIISLSGLKKGENIFKFNNSVISKIKENTYIDSVEIKRKLPDTVSLNIKEREVKYQINLINSYAYIDKNGYILENSTVKKDVPIIYGLSIKEDELLNQKRLGTEDLEKLRNISKILESAKTIKIENLITEINIENLYNYILIIQSENKKIEIGEPTNLTNKMLYIQRILENEKGKTGTAFVGGDINAGFKPYFREE